jgi:formate-dependent nitrite reductase cytochrome c552 subunit
MKIPTFKNCFFGILSTLLIILSGWTAYSDQGGVIQIYKNATVPFDDETKVDSVLPIPEKTVLVKGKYQGGTFWTETRKEKIERFKCSQCHNNKEVRVARATEMAHGDIALDHGGQVKPLSCLTCHKENERDFLVTEKGMKVDMDHSYQMCGQCHFRQKKDWVGGAHGKRVSYWAGKRVVKNCTSCHDPHSPRFEKRWPKTYSPPFKK